MRTLITGGVVAMTPLVLAVGASPAAAAAASRKAAVAPATIPGHMLRAPRTDATVRNGPVRVAVRAPQGTTRLRVRLGGRDVTGRFHRRRGSLRVGVLRRSDGLRNGRNHLVVVADRSGGRSVVDARSFVLVRRSPGLVGLRVRHGAVTRVRVRVAAPGLAAEQVGSLPRLGRRLAAIRRVRRVRLWLNGRRATRALDRSRPTLWTAALSATHGLHYGVNRLRLLVVEPATGRYVVRRRRFLVRRTRQLASAGSDRASRGAYRVRLNGHRSRTLNGRRPRYRWRIVAKPRGSHPKLRRARSSRPVFRSPRRGRYVVRLTVRGRGRAGRAAAAGSDRVTLKVEPNSLLIPFTGFAVSGGTVGIQVGATFYPNPSPAHGAMQWLTLDRSTLKPTGSGNSWFDGTADGPHGLSALAAAVAGENLDQLVILSYPFAGGPGPPVAPGQMDGFNAVLKTIGVGPIGADILQDHNKLVIAGVPTGGPGSGWYIHGGGPVDGLNGWLMPDTTDNAGGFARYRVQPERPMFDTSSAHTPTTNTMTIRSQKVTDSLPGGASGGFQVAFINPTDFTVSEHRAFATNGGDGSGVTAMAAYLNSQVGGPLDVAVQSIGQVTNPSPRENPSSPNPGDDAWRAVTTALAGFGANPQTFYTADGSYAFLGGTQLERSEVVQSSKTSANDPGANPPQGQSGTLSGRVSMRADGYFIPAAVDAYDKFGLSLYDKVLVPSTPWPYTAAAGEKQPGDYTAALTYISGKLPDLAGWAPNLRQAYIRAPDDFRFSDSKVDLAGLPYPGDGNTCSQSPGSPVQPAPLFTREEFCALSTELQSEFDWIDATKDLFDTYEKALNRSGNLELVNLQNLGETIRKDVDASGGSLIGWSVGSFIGDGLAAGLGLGPEEGAAGWEGLVAVYELIRDLVSEGGSPVGDELTSKVSELSSDTATRLSEAANGLDRLRDVILSDYGRLQAVGSVATGPDWAIDTVTTTNTLTTAASAFFSTQLIPIGFTDVFYLAASPTNGSGDQTPNNCEGPFGTHPYGGAPASGYVQWRFGFNTPDFGPAPSGLWVLTDDDGDYAPANVTDPTFHSVAQGGYGVYLNDFLWQQYKSPPTGDYQCR